MVGERTDDARADDRAWMPPAAPSADSSAEQLAGYSDLTEIGRGGDSIVYRARQDSLNRDVAIKVLLLDDPDTVVRFEREIEITVELGRQHPNIMTVLATGTTGSGRPAIVMDHYERGSLDQRLRENGPFPSAEVVAIGCVLADALQFAHEHGVLHRDVKPQNVMILPTSYVLGDFGIARLADSEHTASAERFTVRHASPQILDGLPPTAQDDVWSLGSTLFTLLDGRTPFASDEPGDDTALAYLRRARSEPHRRPPGDSGLVAVIDRALEKDPDRRWPDVASMRAALEDLRGSFLQAWSPDRDASRSAARATPRADATAAPPPEPGTDSPSSTSPDPIPPSSTSPRPADPEVEAPSSAVEQPAPVALSALAHGPAVPETDAEPTGVVPGAAAAPTPLTEAGDIGDGDPLRRGSDGDEDDEPKGRSKGRIVLALAAVALAVGVTLGALGGILRNDDQGTQDQPPPAPSDTIPSLDHKPVETGDAQALQFDESMKPLITKIDLHGTSATITWRDQSDGKAERFVIAQTAPSRLLLAQVRPDETPYTVDGIDPDAKRVCFVVTAISVDGSVAGSKPTCPKR